MYHILKPINKQRLVDRTGGDKNFFDVKKKINACVWIVLLLIVIGFVVKFLTPINFSVYWKDLTQKSDQTIFILVLIMGFFFFIINDVVAKILLIKGRIQDLGVYIPLTQWIRFAVVTFFISSITPFSIGSEPYGIWWLRKNNIETSLACAIISTRTLAWFCSQFLITWPSFVYLTVQNWTKIYNGQINGIYWAVLIGLSVDIVVGIFLFILGVSNRFHYFVMKVNNTIKKTFNLSFLSGRQLKRRYLLDMTFRNVYLTELFSNRIYMAIVIGLLRNLYCYGLFAIVYVLMSSQTKTFSDCLEIFNIINVATTSNNFFPTPSQEGSLQFATKSLFNLKTGTLWPVKTDQAKEKVINNTILTWRFFEKYLGLVLGMGYISCFGFKNKNTPN